MIRGRGGEKEGRAKTRGHKKSVFYVGRKLVYDRTTKRLLIYLEIRSYDKHYPVVGTIGLGGKKEKKIFENIPPSPP